MPINQKIKLVYGNHHQILNVESANSHEWIAFVDLEKK